MSVSGDFVVVSGWHRETDDFVNRISESERHGSDDRSWTVVSPAKGILVAARGECSIESASSGGFGSVSLVQPAPGHRVTAHWYPVMLRRMLTPDLKKLSLQVCEFHGNFGICAWDQACETLAIMTDPFRKVPIYWAWCDEIFVCSTRLSLVAALLPRSAALSTQAIYDYLNFFYIPAPQTIYHEIYKLRPARLISVAAAKVKELCYWQPTYPEDYLAPESEAADQLRGQLEGAIDSYVGDWPDNEGAFLSGGTDSSTLVALMHRARGGRTVNTFSIGFSEDVYDETYYARVAAEAFNANGDFHIISAEEALAAIPALVDGFDEPFGNPSVIGGLICLQRAAAANVHSMIAGDGGDEVFGGNERYAKDRILEAFYRSPGFTKSIAAFVAKLAGHSDHFLANRISNFVRRGLLANPDRMYTDDSFASDHFGELLTPDFKLVISPTSSLAGVQRIYAESDCNTSEIHKLMYLDLQMAIADNDLVKVGSAARLAGIAVYYPFLDQRIVEFTGRLPPVAMLKGSKKRFLFLKAVEDLIPVEIQQKKKHGFGLPISQWFREHKAFRELLRDTVLSDKAIGRGYFQRDYIEKILIRHEKGAWDFGQPLWALLMLELWHQRFADEKPG